MEPTELLATIRQSVQTAMGETGKLAFHNRVQDKLERLGTQLGYIGIREYDVWNVDGLRGVRAHCRVDVYWRARLGSGNKDVAIEIDSMARRKSILKLASLSNSAMPVWILYSDSMPDLALRRLDPANTIQLLRFVPELCFRGR